MYHEHVKGLRSENLVIECLEKQGWCLLRQRFKTQFAEVDLLFQKADIVRMIEVKSLSNWDFVQYRVSKKQKERLFRAYHYFQQIYSSELVLEVALVSSDDDVLFIEIENFY